MKTLRSGVKRSEIFVFGVRSAIFYSVEKSQTLENEIRIYSLQFLFLTWVEVRSLNSYLAVIVTTGFRWIFDLNLGKLAENNSSKILGGKLVEKQLAGNSPAENSSQEQITISSKHSANFVLNYYEVLRCKP